MRDRIIAELLESAEVKRLVAERLGTTISTAAERIIDCLSHGGKILFCGNGGSASDCQHLAAELAGKYRRERSGLAAIALTTDTSLLTATANDYGFERVFSRQVEALGRSGDMLVAISTSGQSRNVNLAVEAARAGGLYVIALTGRDGGRLAQIADLPIIVPSKSTARIQESHIAIGHAICEAVDLAFEQSSQQVIE